MKIKPQQAIEGRTYPCAALGVVPSVTTVLKVLEKRHLETWRARVGRKEADRVSGEAKVIGTRVHSMAERLAWDRKYQPPTDLEPFAVAVRSFLNAHVRKPLKTELSLVSAAERVGGTLDLWCILQDGSYAVVDFKTSAQLTREHGLQTALYALLLREHGYEVNKRIVVKISKSKPGTFYARSYGDHAGDVKAARAAVELWHWLHRNKLLKAMEAA